MLSDIITETDTSWTLYTRQTATGCSYPLVPSILLDPLMSSKTAASWADGGTVTWDTLDTCVVEILDTNLWIRYSIDMQRGLVVGLFRSDGINSAQHQYFYGCEKGIYYLRKVTFSIDTTLEYGGYEFYNIRLNGEPVPVINQAKRNPERFSIQWLNKIRGTMALTGIQGPAKVALFDVRGRRIAPGYREVTGMFEINSLCPSIGCPSGPVLLRIENSGGVRVFPTVFVR
jgi:hypothetical protein